MPGHQLQAVIHGCTAKPLKESRHLTSAIYSTYNRDAPDRRKKCGGGDNVAWSDDDMDGLKFARAATESSESARLHSEVSALARAVAGDASEDVAKTFLRGIHAKLNEFGAGKR